MQKPTWAFVELNLYFSFLSFSETKITFMKLSKNKKKKKKMQELIHANSRISVQISLFKMELHIFLLGD